MYLKNIQDFRKKVITDSDFICLFDYGTELFDGKIGHLPIASWVTRNSRIKQNFTSVRLVDFCYSKRDQKCFEYHNTKNHYCSNQSNFLKIESMPIAYWLSNKAIEVLETNKCFEKVATTRAGMITGNNELFVRYWFEINNEKMNKNADSRDSAKQSKLKWFPYSKGGNFRKWYGNNESVVNWYNDGFEMRNRKDEKGNIPAHAFNLDYIFKTNICWNSLSTNRFSARLTSKGFIYDAGGSFASVPQKYVEYYLGFLNSGAAYYYLTAFNPTLNFQKGNVGCLPIVIDDSFLLDINCLVKNCLRISKEEWDSFETSWDFSKHPFVINSLLVFGEGFEKTHCILLSDVYRAWESECNERFNKLKANEEELNRIFIDIYGLQDELTPEVEDKDVTVRKADLQRDVRSFISYAVGCMFGRYSLDREGLVFAGGDFNKTYWRFKGQAALDENGYAIEGGYAGISMASYHYPRFKDSDYWGNATKLRFEPDADNCIPITDTAYFEDDIVGRFCEFVKVVYGEDTLEANLEFIAKALGNKGNTSRDIIRNYFLNDFFKDHCKIYQKRPIYWLFDSGKQNGFKALVYMHRWNADTIGNMRVEYLHRIQRTYEKEIEREQDTIDNTTNNRDRATATKRKEKLLKQLKEAKDYDAMVAHLALSRPDIDLDDGVKVNYEKVQTAQDGKKLQILAKI